MIKLKLHELMVERKLFKISEIHELTKKYHKGGIDRRILTVLRSGRADRVQFFVLDVLCRVFKCSVNDLVEFVDD